MKLLKRISRFALALVSPLAAASARADVLVIPDRTWPPQTPEPIHELPPASGSGLLPAILLIAALLVVTALLVRRHTRRS